MSLRIDLLRHGETEQGGGFRGRIDDALTCMGWAQMEQAVLGRAGWTRLLSSPLRRCAAFAEHLAAIRGLPLETAADFRELDFGAWEGLSASQLMDGQSTELGLFWSDPYAYTPPGGEPLADFEARVLGALRHLAEGYRGEHLLLISHGGVIRLLLARARGLAPRQLLQVEAPHGGMAGLRVGLDNGVLCVEEVR